MGLQDAIASAQQTHEQRLAASLNIEKPELTSDERRLVGIFQKFCAEKGVRAIPAAPATVAAFVQAQSNADIIPMVEAIAAAHDHYGLANPSSTYSVRVILERRLRIEFPRSWSKQDRLLFAALPPEVRAVVGDRERQRDSALRRAQNALADEKKRLTAEAKKNSVIEDKEQLSL
jgi:hypothetical protein